MPKTFQLPAFQLTTPDDAWIGAEDAGRLVLIKRTRVLTATAILTPLSGDQVAAIGADLQDLSLDLDGQSLRPAGKIQHVRSLSLICRWAELRPDIDGAPIGGHIYAALLQQERHAHAIRADVMIVPTTDGQISVVQAQLREIQGLLKRVEIRDALPVDAPRAAPSHAADPADLAGLAGQRLWSATSQSEGGSGYTREEIYSFYKDRTVLYQRLTTLSIGGSGGLREHTARGRWVSDKDSVTVRFEDGTIRRYALQLSAGGARLDGEFYRRGPLSG